MDARIITTNRRALARYDVSEKLEVGIALVGAEVKSLRAGKLELSDAFAEVLDGELILRNATIAPYAFSTVARPEERRPRKLLAHRAEIDRLEGKITQKGFTLIALQAYFKGSRVKIELGLARGKDTADRRQEIRKREGEREARAAMARARKR